MTLAASPDTIAKRTGTFGDMVKNVNSSPLDAVVEPMCPKTGRFGSQKILSKANNTLFRFPYPIFAIAAVFHSGSCGTKCTILP